MSSVTRSATRSCCASEAELQQRVRYKTVSSPKMMDTRVWDMLTGLYNHRHFHERLARIGVAE